MMQDMSAEAITNRLKRVSQLRRMCLLLARAGKSGSERKEPNKSGMKQECK
mgnify:CR=1 FL=1